VKLMEDRQTGSRRIPSWLKWCFVLLLVHFVLHFHEPLLPQRFSSENQGLYLPSLTSLETRAAQLGRHQRQNR